MTSAFDWRTRLHAPRTRSAIGTHKRTAEQVTALAMRVAEMTRGGMLTRDIATQLGISSEYVSKLRKIGAKK